MKLINTNLLNEAISTTWERALHSQIVFDGERMVDTIWNEYNQLVLKSKEDKKVVNINLLMKLENVTGAEWDWQNNRVLVRTKYGDKWYKTGKVNMSTIVKRVKNFLEIYE